MASSPTALSRISIVGSESIATTLSNASSNNLASPTPSPATSGGLSPLSPDPQSRTFKEAMQPKKPLHRAHSAFTDERILDSEEYLKFQKVLEGIKSQPAPPVEKYESKRGVAAKTFNSPLSLRQKGPTFVELATSKEYFKRFPIKKKMENQNGLMPSVLEEPLLWNAHVDQAVCSKYNRPVTAYDIDESIAVFWLNSKAAHVVHFSSATNTIKKVVDNFARFEPQPAMAHQIYLVGGDGSPESMQLLHNIHSAILIYFGPNGKIVESFINPNKDRPFHSVSVAYTPKRQFFFCRHD